MIVVPTNPDPELLASFIESLGGVEKFLESFEAYTNLKVIYTIINSDKKIELLCIEEDAKGVDIDKIKRMGFN